MWFFAALVVVVMGGVAALAAGRGAPMADAYDDRPDALVPREGPLRAEDLRAVRFSLAVRGYRMSEVDALLDRLAGELEQARRTEPLDPLGQSGPGAAPDAGTVPAPDAARDDQPDAEARGEGTAR